MPTKFISIGEVLWDVIGDTEHIGGAPLNFAAHVSKLGHHCSLVSAVGDDRRGRDAMREIATVGLSTDFVTCVKEHPTGSVTVALNAGQPTFTIHRPAAYDFASLNNEQLEALVQQSPEWIYYGTLAQTSPIVRRTTQTILDAIPSAKRFYDINLRAGCYTREIVEDLLANATVVKLNDLEIGTIATLFGDPPFRSIEHFAREYSERYGLESVCVTCGENGCGVLLNGCFKQCPGYTVQVVDTVGAGDAFAAGFVHALSLEWDAGAAGRFANRLGALVASRAGAIPFWQPDDLDLIAK